MSDAAKILIALLVGAAAGYFGNDLLNPPPSSDPAPTATKRDGGEGLTPCNAAGSIPPGQWSKVPCGTQQACAILDQIQQLAVADATAGRLSAGMLAQINDLLIKCATNTAPVQLGGSEHCQKINAAKQAAVQHNWQLCIEQMQHEH